MSTPFEAPVFVIGISIVPGEKTEAMIELIKIIGLIESPDSIDTNTQQY